MMEKPIKPFNQIIHDPGACFAIFNWFFGNEFRIRASRSIYYDERNVRVMSKNGNQFKRVYLNLDTGQVEQIEDSVNGVWLKTFNPFEFNHLIHSLGYLVYYE